MMSYGDPNAPDVEFCRTSLLEDIEEAYRDGSAFAAWLYILASEDRHWPAWVKNYLILAAAEVLSRGPDERRNKKAFQALRIKKPQASFQRIKPLAKEVDWMRKNLENWAKSRWYGVDELTLSREKILEPLVRFREVADDEGISRLEGREIVGRELRLSDESGLRRQVRQQQKKLGIK